MGVVCYENPSMGIYFIEDPDGYWLEIIPKSADPRYFAVNLCTVTDRKTRPGSRIVVGKFGWFGESGKCWVSRQKAACFWYAWPPLPTTEPSRKFPV